MKFIILRGTFTKKFFGIQIEIGNKYILQWACWKFGIYNRCTHTWWPS